MRDNELSAGEGSGRAPVQRLSAGAGNGRTAGDVCRLRRSDRRCHARQATDGGVAYGNTEVSGWLVAMAGDVIVYDSHEFTSDGGPDG